LIFKYFSIIFKSHYNRTRTALSLHEDQYTFFLIISRSVLRIRQQLCRISQHSLYIPFSLFFFANPAVYKIMLENMIEQGKPQWQYGARALHAGYLRLQTLIQAVKYTSLFHRNNGCMNAPHCYVIRTLHVLSAYATR